MCLLYEMIILISIFTFSIEGESGADVCGGDVLSRYSTCKGDGSECNYQFRIGHCISCDNTTCEVIRGTSFLDLEINDFLTADTFSGMYNLSNSTSCKEVNDHVCGSLNRDGLLCSQCKPGYGPAPYSSAVKCFKCDDNNSERHWVKYLALELLPATIFYFVVIFFNVRTTAPPYTAFVFFNQLFTLIYKIYPYLRVRLKSDVNEVLLHSSLTLTSFWNLDYFRHAVPPFCISSRLTDRDVVFLECISALYPLLLLVVTFVLIELHARNFRLLVILWKPIHRYFTNCRRNLDPKSSTIAAFATFISLAFNKILFITILIMLPGNYFTIGVGGVRLKGIYDPSIQGNTTADYVKHIARILYFAPLLIIFIIAQLPTLLLLLYPIRAFRRLITCCGSSRHHAIYVFMDTFQGHYKDGTNGSRDYRAASSISFILRDLCILSLSSPWTRVGVASTHGGYSIMIYLLVITALFYSIVRPCKKKYMNVIESVVYCASGLMLLSFGEGHSSTRFSNKIGEHAMLYLSLLILGLPSLILLFSFAAKISVCLCCTCRNNFTLRVQGWCQTRINNFIGSASDANNIPDRLENPMDYDPIP